MADEEADAGLTAWTIKAMKGRNLPLEGYCETEGCGQFYVFKPA